MDDHSFERTIQITKIALLAALLLLGAIAYWRAHMAESGFTYANITTATNTLLKGAPGTLHTIVLGTIGTATTLTMVDTTAANCTGGTPIGIITLAANMPPQLLDLQFNNGLCITSAGAGNVIVTFR